MKKRVGDYIYFKRNIDELFLDKEKLLDKNWGEKIECDLEEAESFPFTGSYKVEDIKRSTVDQLLVSFQGEFFAVEDTENIEVFPRIGDEIFANNRKCKVVAIKNCGDSSPLFAAEAKKKFKDGHDCQGLTEDGKGYWYEWRDIKEIYRQENTIERIDDLTKEIKELTDELRKKDKVQDLLTGAIIDKAKDIAVDDLKLNLKEKIDKYIEEEYGVLPKKIIVETPTKHKELEGIFHKEFENICKIVAKNIPLMLVGSAGAGKNYTLEQVAEALDLKFYFSNAVNQEYKLTGFIDANGKYHETEFYKAFVNGGMFFLDEIDASCPECLVILNSAIANKYFDFPTGRVKAHEDFRIVCAGNTYGTGADMVYVGRNVLDGATLDRFVVLQFDYDEEVEKQLAYDNELYLFIKDLRKAINDSGLRYIVSMRAIINATKLLEIGVPKNSILKTAIIKNMQIDDINTIISKMKDNNYQEWMKELREISDVKS